VAALTNYAPPIYTTTTASSNIVSISINTSNMAPTYATNVWVNGTTSSYLGWWKARQLKRKEDVFAIVSGMAHVPGHKLMDIVQHPERFSRLWRCECWAEGRPMPVSMKDEEKLKQLHAEHALRKGAAISFVVSMDPAS